MKNRPRIGLTGELAFQFEPQHAIYFAGGGNARDAFSPISSGSSNAPRAKRSLVALKMMSGRSASRSNSAISPPPPVGHTIHCTARVIHAEDREVTFQISARDERELIARGLHKRAIIRVDRFTQRVQEKSTQERGQLVRVGVQSRAVGLFAVEAG